MAINNISFKGTCSVAGHPEVGTTEAEDIILGNNVCRLKIEDLSQKKTPYLRHIKGTQNNPGNDILHLTTRQGRLDIVASSDGALIVTGKHEFPQLNSKYTILGSIAKNAFDYLQELTKGKRVEI